MILSYAYPSMVVNIVQWLAPWLQPMWSQVRVRQGRSSTPLANPSAQWTTRRDVGPEGSKCELLMCKAELFCLLEETEGDHFASLLLPSLYFQCAVSVKSHDLYQRTLLRCQCGWTLPVY